MRAILGSLHEAASALPDATWRAVCLDTLIHVAGANGGVLLDACGVGDCYSGLTSRDAQELATISLFSGMPDGRPVQVHLPCGLVDAMRVPLRADGRTLGTLVLTSDSTDPFGIDVGALVPILAGVARDMLGTTPTYR